MIAGMEGLFYFHSATVVDQENERLLEWKWCCRHSPLVRHPAVARRDNCIHNYKKNDKIKSVKFIRIKMIESSSFIASSLGLGDCHEVTHLCEKL